MLHLITVANTGQFEVSAPPSPKVGEAKQPGCARAPPPRGAGAAASLCAGKGGAAKCRALC